MNATFTIRAGDKASAGRCSRCGTAKLGAKPAAAEWNKVQFTYCTECAFAAEEEEKKK